MRFCTNLRGAMERVVHLQTHPDNELSLTDVWGNVFTGGVDGHQHIPLRLVLPLLRFRGSVLLHAASLGGE